MSLARSGDLLVTAAISRAHPRLRKLESITDLAMGLPVTLPGVVPLRIEAVPCAVGLSVTAASWFTALTSFANLAVTPACALTDTFADIAPNHVAPFGAAQRSGAPMGVSPAAGLGPSIRPLRHTHKTPLAPEELRVASEA